jgi:hypothetical protein
MSRARRAAGAVISLAMDEASGQLLAVKSVRPGVVYQLQHEGTWDMARGLAYDLMDGDGRTGDVKPVNT